MEGTGDRNKSDIWNVILQTRREAISHLTSSIYPKDLVKLLILNVVGVHGGVFPIILSPAKSGGALSNRLQKPLSRPSI